MNCRDEIRLDIYELSQYVFTCISTVKLCSYSYFSRQPDRAIEQAEGIGLTLYLRTGFILIRVTTRADLQSLNTFRFRQGVARGRNGVRDPPVGECKENVGSVVER